MFIEIIYAFKLQYLQCWFMCEVSL